jgi:hypothetical protein
VPEGMLRSFSVRCQPQDVLFIRQWSREDSRAPSFATSTGPACRTHSRFEQAIEE